MIGLRSGKQFYRISFHFIFCSSPRTDASESHTHAHTKCNKTKNFTHTHTHNPELMTCPVLRFSLVCVSSTGPGTLDQAFGTVIIISSFFFWRKNVLCDYQSRSKRIDKSSSCAYQMEILHSLNEPGGEYSKRWLLNRIDSNILPCLPSNPDALCPRRGTEYDSKREREREKTNSFISSGRFVCACVCVSVRDNVCVCCCHRFKWMRVNECECIRRTLCILLVSLFRCAHCVARIVVVFNSGVLASNMNAKQQFQPDSTANCVCNAVDDDDEWALHACKVTGRCAPTEMNFCPQLAATAAAVTAAMALLL